MSTNFLLVIVVLGLVFLAGIAILIFRFRTVSQGMRQEKKPLKSSKKYVPSLSEAQKKRRTSHSESGEVFLSYAREDLEKARLLSETLTQYGWSVWWDRTIPVGMSFDIVIETAIQTAGCVVVLWSNASVNSDWVKTEAAEGARRRVLVPVLIESTKIPLEFRRIQAADLRDWKGESTHPQINTLIDSISRITGKKPLYSG